MIARLLSILTLVGTLNVGAIAVGQDVIVYRPIAEPVVAASPVPAYGPVVVSRPPVTVYRPMTVYSPVVQPTIAVPAQPVVVTSGRPVVVRSKVYVPGQPVRNVLRAVTP